MELLQSRDIEDAVLNQKSATYEYFVGPVEECGFGNGEIDTCRLRDLGSNGLYVAKPVLV